MQGYRDNFILKVKVLDILIFIFLLFEFRLFFIISLPGYLSKINTYHNKLLEVFLMVFICAACKKYKICKLEYSRIVIAFFVIASIGCVYTIYRYPGAELKEILVPYSAYWLLLLYFPISQYFRDVFNFKRFIGIVRVLGCISSMIVIIQAFVYNFYGRYFLFIYEFNDGENIVERSGIRITYLSTAVSIALVFSIVELIVVKRKKLMNMLTMVLGMFYFIYVSQTRIYILIFVLLALYAFYFMNDLKKSRAITVLLVSCAIVIGVWALDIVGYIAELLMPIMDGSYVYNGSYYARLGAYKYFWITFLKNPIMGLGLMKPSKSSVYFRVICGPRGIAHYTDVGLFGTLAEFGIPMVLVFIIMMKKSFVKKNDDIIDYYTPYKRIFWMFILLSCGTLSVLDPQRIIVLALAMAIFDCRVGK